MPLTCDAGHVELAIAADAVAVVLVEGGSDQAAIEALAGRRGRDLQAEGTSVVPIGGATNITRYLAAYAATEGPGPRMCGLCDAGE